MAVSPLIFKARRASGFTLIEVMIVVAIVAILARIAYPAYTDYIRRGNLVDATNALTNVRAQMEQYYQDNRTYVGGPCATSTTVNGGVWTVACTPVATAITATTYTITATGGGQMAGFAYTINQDGTTTSTTTSSTAWGASTCTGTSFVMKKGGSC